jgi:hypothetical protein
MKTRFLLEVGREDAIGFLESVVAHRFSVKS